ncbi:MAG: CRISPR-associated endonuclease Cas1, partial [Chloroflexota bacterium]
MGAAMHSLAVTEQGTEVHVQGDTLVLHRGGKPARIVRLQELREVLLFGRVEVTSAAVAVLARRGVDLVWLTAYGYYRARLLARGSRNVELRLAQFRRVGDAGFAVRVARAIVAGKILHQRALEKDIESRIQTMLERIVGTNKAVVRVSGVLDFRQVELTEERFDPNGQVVRSEQRNQEKASGVNGIAGGVPGVSSNVPAAQSTEPAQTSNSNNQSKSETLNYEISRTVSRIVEP